jgi:hydroxymethylbilane synthase
MSFISQPLRLGTRGSLLARMQSELIANQIRALSPGLAVETVIVKTTGDRIQDKQLHEVGGKGLFTKELEQALLAGEIDFAVHSYKDVPVTMPLVDVSALVIAGVPRREDPRDVLVTRDGVPTITDLPRGARIGTGSLRRRCQVLSIRPDLQVTPIRGNIDTRLRKLRDGELDAVILAAAGLHRAELFDAAVMMPVEVDQMIPSPGQGALALQCRSADTATAAILQLLNDRQTMMCVDLERQLVQLLQADCHSPLGIHARIAGETIQLAASVGGYAGIPPVITATVQSGLVDATMLPGRLFHELCTQDVMARLHRPG